MHTSTEPAHDERLLVETAWSDNLRVDRDNKVIHDVKILGRQSRNGRVYSDQAMAEAAALYDGCDVNIDHPAEGENAASRRLADGFGALRNVRIEADAVFGDLHYFDQHPLAALVLERAERMPGSFGLSHNAAGRVSQREGQIVVEGIDRVLSVDLVRNPATTSGLFEELRQPSSREGETLLAELLARIERLESALTARRLLERRSIDPASIDEARFAELIALGDAAKMSEAISQWPPYLTAPHARPPIASLREVASEAHLAALREPRSLARAIA
jgi:hypothetical protein